MPDTSIMKFPILQNPVIEAGITAATGKERNTLALGLLLILMMAKAGDGI